MIATQKDTAQPDKQPKKFKRIPRPDEQQPEPELVVVKVKRSSCRDDIEELQIEFGAGGTLKRQKLVTQNEVLVRNFNQSMQITPSKNVGFQLGTAGQQNAQKPVVRLRRLICNNDGDQETTKIALQKMMQETRQKKRNEKIKQMRGLSSDGKSTTLDSGSEPEFKVISLTEEEEKVEQCSIVESGDSKDYFYFLAQRAGKFLVDPFSGDSAHFNMLCDQDEKPEYDHDSEDSNRESAEGNDYPDEEDMIHSDGRSLDSYDESPLHTRNQIKTHDLGKRVNKNNDDQQMISDNENENDVQLKPKERSAGMQSWLDKALRKNKNGATISATIKNQLDSQNVYGESYSSDDYHEYYVQDSANAPNQNNEDNNMQEEEYILN